MAQAGIHGLAGILVRKWLPSKELLFLGIVLGNILPDADNLAVAAATVTGRSTEGLHRTFTHSFITVAGVILVFYLFSKILQRPAWANLGLGLGIGITMHTLLDLIIWFNGVDVLWPFPSWVNFWEGIMPPEWWAKLMLPIEFLFFALFFVSLAAIVRQHDLDKNKLKTLKVHTIIQLILFLIFTPLVYILESGFMTPYGAIYLISLGIAISLSIQLRDSIEYIS